MVEIGICVCVCLYRMKAAIISYTKKKIVTRIDIYKRRQISKE